jgi:hypothetical protein
MGADGPERVMVDLEFMDWPPKGCVLVDGAAVLRAVSVTFVR